MTGATVAAVTGAAALPLVSCVEVLDRRAKLLVAALCTLLAGIGLLTHPAAAGPAGFALLAASGLVTSFWRTDAIADNNQRKAQGIPPLMDGNPAIRGLYDIFWLARHRRKMKENPIDQATG